MARISEGMRRLRLFGTACTAIAAYLIMLLSERLSYWDDEDLFIKLPLFSLFFAALAYITFTGIHWVSEGFRRTPSSERGLTSKSLQSLFNKAVEKIHSTVANELAMESSGVPELDALAGGMSISWKRACIPYCYGLVSICMLKSDPKFFNSELNRELGSYALKQMVNCSKAMIGEIAGDKMPSDTQLAEKEAPELKNAIAGALYFRDHLAKNKKGEPLLQLIVALVKTIGIDTKSSLLMKLSIESKILIQHINQEIEARA